MSNHLTDTPLGLRPVGEQSIMGDIVDFIYEDIWKETIAIRKLGSSFYKSTDISMDEYPKDTQELLRAIVEQEGSGLVDKKDLDKYKPEGYSDSYIDKVFSPWGQIQNTLGQFTIKNNKVTDTYDFSSEYEGMSYIGHGYRNTLGKLHHEFARDYKAKSFSFEVK